MTFDLWRARARSYLAAGVAPQEATFDEDQGTLFAAASPAPDGRVRSVPRAFLDRAATVALHRDPDRWLFLYRVLYRIASGERHLLEIECDPDTARFAQMERAVGHDIHRMHAFVRFRRIEHNGAEEFIAWHRPDHYIVESAAPWFVRRFANMRWSILTPDGSAVWDTESLRFGPGVPRSQAPEGDELESLWLAYYGSIFNPARLNPELLQQHLPARHWATLPETQIVASLVARAGQRAARFIDIQPRSAAPFVPPGAGLDALRSAIRCCEGCDLYRDATQPVFGEGPANAALMFVGEQPGDNEDIAGRPFVGPAGQLFDRALADVGLDRSSIYLTGAVKHFKFEERGKRRIHKTASRAEVVACQPWLEAEIGLVRPRLLVIMGATAARSVLGRDCSVLRERGRILSCRHGSALLTVHPSFLLRMPDPARQQHEYELFREDLRLAAQFQGHAA